MQLAEQLNVQESARSIVYRRLSDAFRPPSDNLLEELEQLRSALADLDSDSQEDAGRLKEYFQALPDKGLLQVDYTKLFIGPFMIPAPPYGSVYLEKDRRLMGDSTVDVRHHYLSRGLDLASDFREAPDHICAELEFMYFLTQQSLAAINQADEMLLLELVQQQHVFLTTHLGAWIPEFAGRIIEHCQTGFYRCLANVTQKFIAEQIAMLKEITSRGPKQINQRS